MTPPASAVEIVMNMFIKMLSMALPVTARYEGEWTWILDRNMNGG